MSQTIAIQTTTSIDTNDLAYFLQSRIAMLKAEQRAEEGFYFYQDKQSTRGVDFWKENYGYELRTTILASPADYEIVKWILVYFLTFAKEATYVSDEDESIKKDEVVEFATSGSFEADANLIKLIIENNSETITFYGPKGEFYIGSNVLQKLESQKDGWHQKLSDLILQIQYQFPVSENDTVMQMGDENNKKIVKLVVRNVDYVLKQFDYLIFTKIENSNNFDDFIFITNEVLNQHLPDMWTLLDEYTIVAPALTNSAYSELFAKLAPYDCKKELKKN